MRYFLAFSLLALTTAVAGADPWINLFDGESLYGWNALGAAKWQASDGNIVYTEGAGGWLATTSEFADFELTARVKIAADSSAGFAVRAAYDGSPAENGSYVLVVKEPKGSTPDWHDIQVTANGDSVTATLDGKEAAPIGGGRKYGHIGILPFDTGEKVEVTAVKLRPLNMKPIFNGTDLTGWNIFPGKKSEFTVVDGAINIKNGNGQIETAAEFKNFTLQLDIFSNGDHLNSGVFFRNPAGRWWRGYESQVRNQWEGDDRTKPVDFGTGGIYGDQPARKVVSSDREWFTKTVVACGNHFAVWINGYQVSDFEDMRPVARDGNGKAGYVPGPGTIHLQGHDPTTDLSFRNILVQEYMEK